MNLRFLFKYRLVVFLAIVVVLMGAIKFGYRDVNWEEVEVVPTAMPSPTSAPQINNNYPLWEFIPYSGNGFKIDYYIEPLKLAVKIEKGVDEIVIREEIYNWMRENKVATESHELVFEKE